MGFFRRQKREPGFAKDTYVIVGLGNPGKEYADTRHNMGYKAIDVLSSDENIEIRKHKFHSLIGQGRIAGKNHNDIITVILHFLDDGGDGFVAESVFISVAEGIGFVNKQHAAAGFSKSLLNQRGGRAYVIPHQI